MTCFHDSQGMVGSWAGGRNMLGHKRQRMGPILLLVSGVCLGGCIGNFQLVSTSQGSVAAGWHQYVTPRAPKSPLEDAVVEVAQTGKSREIDNRDIHFIYSDTTKREPVDCVEIVEKSTGGVEATQRKVTHYRVVKGQIAALSDPADEFFVDVNMERAIMRAVAQTWGPNRVLFYQDGARSYAISSNGVGKCGAEVTIYSGDKVGQVPIGTKTINFCFAR